jgi:hypothetical protein
MESRLLLWGSRLLSWGTIYYRPPSIMDHPYTGVLCPRWPFGASAETRRSEHSPEQALTLVRLRLTMAITSTTGSLGS